MNGTSDKRRQIQGCFSPGGGEYCKGSDQSGASAPRSALAWTGRCLRVDVAPWRNKKNCIFETQFDLVHTFGNILLKKYFKVNYWIHNHVGRSSHFSCFDAFVRTFINLWKFKKRVSEGEFPLRSFWGGVLPSEDEKIQFSNSIRCIPFANILLKTIIHFQ